MVALYRGYHSELLLEELRKHWKNAILTLLFSPQINDFSFLRHIPGDFCFIGDWPVEIVSQIRSLPRPQSWDNELGFDEINKPILGVLTSGTQRQKPALVLYSEKNILASLNGIISLFDRTSIENIFCLPQPTHTFGLLLGYVLSIQLNCKLHFSEGKYSTKSIDYWFSNRSRGTLTLGTPAHFYDLLLQQKHYPQVQSYSCIIGGAPVDVEMWKSIQNSLKIEAPSIGYGCTEASPGLTHLPPGYEPQETGDIGYPLPGIEISIEKGTGITFNGENSCLAIANENTISSLPKVLIKDDLEIIEESHHRATRYRYLGRTDLCINRGGTKLYIEEVEQFLLKHLGVRAVLISVPDLRLGEDLGLLIQYSLLKPETIMKSFVDTLKTKFQVNFNEKNIKFVEKIPLNSNQKIDRNVGKALFFSADEQDHKILTY